MEDPDGAAISLMVSRGGSLLADRASSPPGAREGGRMRATGSPPEEARGLSMIVIVAVLLAAAVAAPLPAMAAESAVVIPAPAVDDPKAAGPLQTAVLAGGC